MPEVPRYAQRFEPWLPLGTMATAIVTFHVPAIRPVLLPKLRRYFATPESSDVLALGLIGPGAVDGRGVFERRLGRPVLPLRADRAAHPLVLPDVSRRRGARRRVHGCVHLRPRGAGAGVYGGWKDSNLNSFIGALMTPMLAGLVPNYLWQRVARSSTPRVKDAVEALGDSDLFFRVVATSFPEGGRVLNDALPNVVSAMLESSRFDRALLLIPDDGQSANEMRVYGAMPAAVLEPQVFAQAFAGEEHAHAVAALPRSIRGAFSDCEWAGVVPLRSRGRGRKAG